MATEPLPLQFLDAALAVLEVRQYQNPSGEYVVITGGAVPNFAFQLHRVRARYVAQPALALLTSKLLLDTNTAIERYAGIVPGLKEQEVYTRYQQVADQVRATLEDLQRPSER